MIEFAFIDGQAGRVFRAPRLPSLPQGRCGAGCLIRQARFFIGVTLLAGFWFSSLCSVSNALNFSFM